MGIRTKPTFFTNNKQRKKKKKGGKWKILMINTVDLITEKYPTLKLVIIIIIMGVVELDLNYYSLTF